MNYASGEVPKRYPRRCTAAPGTKWAITKYAEVCEPGARMRFFHWDGSDARACQVFEDESLFDQWIKSKYAVETFDHHDQPTDKDPHCMYAAEPSKTPVTDELVARRAELEELRKTVDWYKRQSLSRDDYLFQIKQTVDKCAKIIGDDKAYGLPFDLCVGLTIHTLQQSATTATSNDQA
jgi:hypothetical protein